MIRVIDYPNKKVIHICHELCPNHFMKGTTRLDGSLNLDYRYCLGAGQRIKDFPFPGQGGGNKKEPLCLIEPNTKNMKY